jgi:DNA-binding IclR family transcriptional regulator
MSSPTHHVKSVATALKIVKVLENQDKMGVTEISQKTGITKSSVYKYLDTLRHHGYVTKDGTCYSLSLSWFHIGQKVRKDHDVFKASRDKLDRLARQTGETVSLVVEENGDAVYLYQVTEQKQPMGPVEEGGRVPSVVSTGGKAILSYRPIEEVERILFESDLEGGMPQLRPELEDLRDQRIVIERDNPRRGAFSAGAFSGHRHEIGDDQPYQNLHSIAIPIRDPNNYAIAAVEVSGAETSLYGQRLEEEIASQIVTIAKTIETKLLPNGTYMS